MPAEKQIFQEQADDSFWRRGLGTLGLPRPALVTEPAATRQVGAQMQILMRATQRAAAWQTMEPMAATLRRNLLLNLGRC